VNPADTVAHKEVGREPGFQADFPPTNLASFYCHVVQFNLKVAYLTNPCRLPPCKSHFPLFLSA
jgi:hypothetical protein